MKKAIALLLVGLVGLGLMGYSASRTLALLQMVLPAGQKDLGVLGLLAFDGGLVCWSLTFMWGARGSWQRGISFVMIVVCLAGSIIGFAGDTLLNAQSSGMISNITQEASFSILIATVGIIAANIAAVVFFHILSPENQKQMAEEAARDKIEEATIKRMATDADNIAGEVVPSLSEAWKKQMRSRYSAQAQEIENRVDDEQTIADALAFLRGKFQAKESPEAKEFDASGSNTPQLVDTGKNETTPKERDGIVYTETFAGVQPKRKYTKIKSR